MMNIKRQSSLDASQFPGLFPDEFARLSMTVDFMQRFYRVQHSFHDALAGHRTGQWPRGRLISLGQTPEALTLAGADKNLLTTAPSVLDKVTQHKHGLPYEILKLIPRALHHPVMIFKSTTTGIVVMTDLQHDGKTCVAAVHLNSVSNQKPINEIKSFYTKDDPRVFSRWGALGLCLYQDKKKSQDWSASSGLYLPGGGQTYQLDSGFNVPDETALVNTPPEKILRDPQSRIFYSPEYLLKADSDEVLRLTKQLKPDAFDPKQAKGFRL